MNIPYLLRSPLGWRDSRLAIIVRFFMKWWLRRGGHKLLYLQDNAYHVAFGRFGWDWYVYPGNEYGDYAFIRDYIGPGDLLIDGGSNCGCYSILAASLGANVFAVDVEKYVLDLHDWAIWGQPEIYRRTILVHRALWIAGGCQLGIGRAGAHGQIGGSGPQWSVTTKTIDELCDTRWGREAKQIFIKLDLEGAEDLALRGGRKLLADPRFCYAIIERNWQSSDDVERMMREAGFGEYTYDVGKGMVVRGRIEKLKHRYWAESNGLWGRIQ